MTTGTSVRSFTLNGTPLERIGLQLLDPEGWLTFPRRNFREVELVGRDGREILTPEAPTEPRMLRFGLFGRFASGIERRETLRRLFREYSGLIEIVAADDPTVSCRGVLQSAEAVVYPTPFRQAAGRVDAVVICHDPLWYAITPKVTTIGAVNVPVAVDLGASSALTRRLVVQVSGPFTSPLTIIQRNASGDELERMTIALSATSAEYIEIDCTAFSITKYAAGVGTDQTVALALNEDFFKVYPQDAPTFAIDKGTAVLYYNPASAV